MASGRPVRQAAATGLPEARRLNVKYQRTKICKAEQGAGEQLEDANREDANGECLLRKCLHPAQPAVLFFLLAHNFLMNFCFVSCPLQLFFIAGLR